MSLGVVSVPAEPAVEVLRVECPAGTCRTRGVGGQAVQLLAWSVMLPVGLRGW